MPNVDSVIFGVSIYDLIIIDSMLLVAYYTLSAIINVSPLNDLTISINSEFKVVEWFFFPKLMMLFHDYKQTIICWFCNVSNNIAK